MAKSIGEFIFDLAKKAGIAETEPFMVAFAQDKELFTKNLSEDLEKGIDNKLISLADAKNNHPEIKGYYHKQVLDGMDSEITRILDELKDDEVKNQVLGEKNTYKRIGVLTGKIKELEGKKANAGKGGDKSKELQDEIDRLNGELRNIKDSIPKIQQEADGKIVGFKKDYLLRSMLQQYKTTLDDLDSEVRATTLSTLINKELQENKAQFTFDEHDNFILLKADGSNYYGDDNKQVVPKAFIEKLLSRNKLLKVNDQSNNGNGDNKNGQRQQQRPPDNANGGEPTKNHTLSSLVKESLKNIDQNASVSVMG